ncbi:MULTISPECIES: dTMP kinase [Bacillus]|uniref:dTMP kinase n=1 Tax=Bacillus TaxID=1386 RepID=UPI00138AFDBB|nr:MULTISPECIES: hypothetical protein [Bacillus]MBD3861250.1 hypothetical protein [Bacillus sp. 28A-2]MCW1837942.1 hypothetical protein [Bacillus xiamenensis]
MGKFICFEGLDGSGKSTIANKVVDKLIYDKEGKILFIDKKKPEFSSGYVNMHMSKIKEILWDYYPDDPLYELGDYHWLYLNASWFATVDKCRITPLLESGSTIIMDNWYFKFLARFKIKKNFNYSVAQMCFSPLIKPDITIFLDVDPSISVKRRTNYSITETGNMDGYSGRTQDNYIKYQNEVRNVLKKMSEDHNWIVVPVEDESEEEIADKVYKIIKSKLRSVV